MARIVGLSRGFVLIVVMGLAVAVAMGSPIAVGSLVGSRYVTLDGQMALPRSTVLNGDRIEVRNNGVAMVALDHGNRMVLGRGTDASFTRDADGVMVSMASGNMSLFHPQASDPFRVRTGDVTVIPEPGYKTLGEIATVRGLLVVTAKDGVLQVEKSGTTRKVAQGKTITISTTADRAPAPGPPGNRHMKHVATESVAIGLGVAALTLGIIEVEFPDHHHHHPAASPVQPFP